VKPDGGLVGADSMKPDGGLVFSDSMGQEAKYAPFRPSHEKFPTVILNGVRNNISDTHYNSPMKFRVQRSMKPIFRLLIHGRQVRVCAGRCGRRQGRPFCAKEAHISLGLHTVRFSVSRELGEKWVGTPTTGRANSHRKTTSRRNTGHAKLHLQHLLISRTCG
jgi:hypothetical protein